MNISLIKNVVTGGTKIFGIGKALVLAHRPELLYGASVVSTVGSVVLAAKGGYEARGRVEEAQNPTINLSNPANPLSNKEKAALTWSCYVPAAIGTVSAVGSTTGLHLVHVKEKKAMAAAALMAIDEIKDQANDMKEQALKILDDEELTPEEKRDQLEGVDWRSEQAWSQDYLPKDGKYPCWDDLANRAVMSNRDYIERAAGVLINEINKKGYANLNLFYDEMDMMESQMGAQLGWTREDVMGYGGQGNQSLVSFNLTELPDGSAATAFWFSVPPTTDYEVRAKSVDR